MITATRQRGSPRWVLAFLAALVAVMAFGVATASAAPSVGAETRVRAHAVVLDKLVEPSEAAQQLGKAVAGPRIVVATGVAAKGAGSVDELLGPLLQSGRAAGVRDLDGELILLVSGKSSLGHYAASGHGEGQAALVMRERGATSGILHMDNPNGIWGYCTSQVPTLLPRGATLDVRATAGAVPPSARWSNSRTFVGNDSDPKTWPR